MHGRSVSLTLPLPAWMLASFLPLPYRPELRNEEMSMGQHNNVEAVLALQIDPIDERRYQKARWWRNANRIMSLFGICLICAIVSLFSPPFCRTSCWSFGRITERRADIVLSRLDCHCRHRYRLKRHPFLISPTSFISLTRRTVVMSNDET